LPEDSPHIGYLWQFCWSVILAILFGLIFLIIPMLMWKIATRFRLFFRASLNQTKSVEVRRILLSTRGHAPCGVWFFPLLQSYSLLPLAFPQKSLEFSKEITRFEKNH